MKVVKTTVPDELAEAVEREAERLDRSVAWIVRRLLEQAYQPAEERAA